MVFFGGVRIKAGGGKLDIAVFFYGMKAIGYILLLIGAILGVIGFKLSYKWSYLLFSTYFLIVTVSTIKYDLSGGMNLIKKEHRVGNKHWVTHNITYIPFMEFILTLALAGIVKREKGGPG